MQYFDTHAHYDFKQFSKDRESLLEALPQAGIAGVVNIGTDAQTSKNSVDLANRYPYIWASVGFHPHSADYANEEGFKQIKELAKNSRVVAIGETGFDYFKGFSSRDNQRRWFARQLELAQALELPVVVHSRDAAEDTLKMLREYNVGRGVVHCFGDNLEYALAYQDMGLFIGIGGIITYPGTKELARAVRGIRLESILLETDCPYLSPNRKERNDSRNLVSICESLASILGIGSKELAQITTENARRFYNLY